MAELVMMDCARRPVRLSTAGCARLWLSANGDKEPEPWESNAICCRCPVGAALNGRSINVAADAIAAIQPICPRCFRVSDRIISGRLCVSCYNRAREVKVGKNAKGGRPLLADVLHSEIIVAIDASGQRVVHSGPVVSAAEAVFGLARLASGPMTFARPTMRPASPQMALPL